MRLALLARRAGFLPDDDSAPLSGSCIKVLDDRRFPQPVPRSLPTRRSHGKSVTPVACTRENTRGTPSHQFKHAYTSPMHADGCEAHTPPMSYCRLASAVLAAVVAAAWDASALGLRSNLRSTSACARESRAREHAQLPRRTHAPMRTHPREVVAPDAARPGPPVLDCSSGGDAADLLALHKLDDRRQLRAPCRRRHLALGRAAREQAGVHDTKPQLVAAKPAAATQAGGA